MHVVSKFARQSESGIDLTDPGITSGHAAIAECAVVGVEDAVKEACADGVRSRQIGVQAGASLSQDLIRRVREEWARWRR